MKAVVDTALDGNLTTQGTNQAKFDGLRNYFRLTARRLGIPGALLGVFYNGQSRFAAYGVTSAEGGMPMSADTVFRIASMTKVFTATLVIRLVQAGLVDLDTPVKQYLPELQLADAEVEARVALRHLLSHTGGWMDDPLMELIADPRVHPEALKDLPQLTPLGSIWSYSTTGFFVASRVIERVTGMPYAEALTHYLTGPLGMSRTGLTAESAITYPVALGHYKTLNGYAVVRPWPTPAWDISAQGLYSTATDLVRFAQFHLDGLAGNGERLVDARLLREMRSAQVDDGTRGLGWVLKETTGESLPNHPGGLYGYACDLLLAPQRGFAIFVAANVSSHHLDRRVLRYALPRYVGLPEKRVAPHRVSETRLREYEGRYIGVSRDLHVSAEHGYLLVQVVRRGGPDTDGVQRQATPTPFRVAFYEGERVVGLDEPVKGDARGTFIRDPDGSVVLFRFPTFIHVRYPSRIKLPQRFVEAHQITNSTASAIASKGG